MLRQIAVYGAMIAACSLAAFAWGLKGEPEDGTRASTLTFLTLAFAQIVHLGNARSSGPVISWRSALGNRVALGAVALAGGLQVLAVSYPPLARVLDVRPPSREDWFIVAVLALAPALVGQAVKSLRRA
jgi:Ca2+-transporting ATPase